MRGAVTSSEKERGDNIFCITRGCQWVFHFFSGKEVYFFFSRWSFQVNNWLFAGFLVCFGKPPGHFEESPAGLSHALFIALEDSVPTK